MKLNKIKSMTVYCSSSNNIDKRYREIAKRLGSYLGKNNINLVYGGGSNGLMGEIAKSVKSSGGYVIGIIPKFLKTQENINTKMDKMIIVNNMSIRKKKLFEKGDAFIALPGGPGTIEEITEVISWHNLNIHKKPIILINDNKYWDPLIKIYKKAYKERFLDINYKNLFYSAKNISEFKKLFKC